MVGILGCREAGDVKLHVERMVGNFRSAGGGVGWGVVACFVTTARFVTKVTKSAAMPARFVINEVVTDRAGIVLL